ncbi:hypothetical protein [Filobacillus milosensis]|nr:hypothetical protein [Filobacillus milosensis]
MKDKHKGFYKVLLDKSEEIGISKRVIQIYIDQVTSRFEVK